MPRRRVDPGCRRSSCARQRPRNAGRLAHRRRRGHTGTERTDRAFPRLPRSSRRRASSRQAHRARRGSQVGGVALQRPRRAGRLDCGDEPPPLRGVVKIGEIPSSLLTDFGISRTSVNPLLRDTGGGGRAGADRLRIGFDFPGKPMPLTPTGSLYSVKPALETWPRVRASLSSANAAIRSAMYSASSLTQPSSADPRVCCQDKPRK